MEAGRHAFCPIHMCATSACCTLHSCSVCAHAAFHTPCSALKNLLVDSCCQYAALAYSPLICVHEDEGTHAPAGQGIFQGNACSQGSACCLSSAMAGTVHLNLSYHANAGICQLWILWWKRCTRQAEQVSQVQCCRWQQRTLISFFKFA